MRRGVMQSSVDDCVSCEQSSPCTVSSEDALCFPLSSLELLLITFTSTGEAEACDTAAAAARRIAAARGMLDGGDGVHVHAMCLLLLTCL